MFYAVFKQYNFEIIEEIHKTIINLLNNLNEHIIAKEMQLQLFYLKALKIIVLIYKNS